jgi:hypothetical protein
MPQFLTSIMVPPSLFLGSFGVLGVLVLLALVIVGILIIIVIAKVLFFILPAAIIALAVWWLTEEAVYAGIAFIAVAVLSLLKH